jgi:hypothetical protein
MGFAGQGRRCAARVLIPDPGLSCKPLDIAPEADKNFQKQGLMGSDSWHFSTPGGIQTKLGCKVNIVIADLRFPGGGS